MDDDNAPPIPASRMFQITEEDLIEMERTLPDLMTARPEGMRTKERKQWEKVQRIVRDIRWRYGPWLECHSIPAGDDE